MTDLPPIDERTFRGWVPNLDGSISFSTFGTCVSPAKVSTSNVGGLKDRYIIAEQKRNLSDAVFPAPEIIEKYFFRSGSFHLVCVARTKGNTGSTRDTLKGLLCLVHPDTWARKLRGLIEREQIELDRCKREFPGLAEHEYIHEEFSERYDALIDELGVHAEFTVRFTLNKTGLATLIAPPAWRWSEYCVTKETKQEQKFIVCSQLFYFLKDLGHRHQHHSPRTDTICDLYPMGDDVQWKYAVFRKIYLKMTEYEWRRLERVYFSSLGILSYVRSFYRIFEIDLAPFNLVASAIHPLENMELSIEASHETMSRTMQSRRAAADKFRNLVIGLVGLVLSFVSLSQMIKDGVIKSSDVSPEILWLDRFIMINPFIAIAWAAGAVTLFYSGAYLSRIKESETIYTVTRVIQSQPRWRGIFFLLAIAALNGLVWLWLYGHAEALVSAVRAVLLFIF